MRVEGDENHPVTQGRLCVRCLTLKDYVYNPSRIIHPMKRARADRGQADKWEAVDRERWQQVLEASDKVIFICDRFEKGANFRRNSFLVDNTSLLLACYNGDPHSGTGQTIRYAHRRGIPVRILTPEKRKASA